MTSARRFAVYLLLLGQVALPACQRNTTYHGASAGGGLVGGFLSAYDIGELVYGVVRARLAAATPNGAQAAAALEARHVEFVAAIDAVITPSSVQNLGPSILALFALVDDGTLPAMAGNVADVMQMLKDEPGQKTLRAVVSRVNTRKIVQMGDVLDYLGRAANYSEIEQLFTALAALIAENSAFDAQGNPTGKPDLVGNVLAFASRVMKEASQPRSGAGAGGLLDGLRAALLAAAPPRVAGSFGAPSWVVRADKLGNPAVAVDPSTRTLFAPFVDADKDGAADVNASGDAVDARGVAIDLPPFGKPTDPGRDLDGRAVDGSGNLIYVYFDAKETLVSQFLQLGGDGLRRGICPLAYDTAQIALGARVTVSAGTGNPADDWQGFDARNPVKDVTWGLFENAKYDGEPVLLRAIAAATQADPGLAERVLVAFGRVLEKLRPIALAPAQSPPTAQDRQRIDDAVALVDQVFATGAGGTSTGRELFDVVHSLGRTARDLPAQLALMIEYKTLALDASGRVDPSRSQLVDRSRPATRGSGTQVENRSILMQLLDLVTDSDGCKTFAGLFGAPLSETMINLMAGQSAGTVGTLADFANNSLVKLYLSLACPAIQDEVASLQSLSASGALNGFLPIAKVFVDRNETRLLIDILKTLDASYPTTLLPYEPTLDDVLKSGAVNAMFDLDDLLVAGAAGGGPLKDPVSGARAIDVIADATLTLVKHTQGGVADRSGARHATRLHLVLDPLRAINDRIYAAAGGQALVTALGYAVSDLLIERTQDASGNDVLKNASLVPFVTHMLNVIARNMPATSAARSQILAASQSDALAFLDSRDFATVIDLGGVLRQSSSAGAIRDALAATLTPVPTPAEDEFGALLKLVVELLETNMDPQPLRDIAGFLGSLLDPAQQKVVPLVNGAARVLSADNGRVIITLVRNAMNVAPTGATPAIAGQSPARVLLSILGDVRAAAGGNAITGGAAPDPVASASDAIAAMIQYVRDPAGLQRIFDIIKNRPHH